MIFGWWNNYKNRAKRERLQAGFDYAAGMLLEHGDGAIEQLEHHIESACAFDDYDDFDRGIQNAINKYTRGSIV